MASVIFTAGPKTGDEPLFRDTLLRTQCGNRNDWWATICQRPFFITQT
jgi:hypothetical protein